MGLRGKKFDYRQENKYINFHIIEALNLQLDSWDNNEISKHHHPFIKET